MSVAENKAVVESYIRAAVNRGDMSAIDRWLSPEYRNPMNPRASPGAEAYKRGVLATRAAFPDIEVSFDCIVAEGEMVAYETTWRGTHLGEWRGIPPTGKKVEWRATAFRRVVDGVVVEGWGTYDWLGVFEQLGATIDPPGP
jgi:steroid delta-isomerase-like uncharacterized protein